MKKYLFLAAAVWASSTLFASEVLTFQTVLSKPVGSFWEVETTTCSYPDVSGTLEEGQYYSWQGQTVVNFGPTGEGGTITLKGGPLQIGLLLMEDGSELVHSSSNGNAAWAFPEDDENTPLVNEGGVVTIYPGGNLTLKSLLVNELFLPKSRTNTIIVKGTLSLAWSSLTVNKLYVKDMKDPNNSDDKFFELDVDTGNPPDSAEFIRKDLPDDGITWKYFLGHQQ